MNNIPATIHSQLTVLACAITLTYVRPSRPLNHTLHQLHDRVYVSAPTF